MELVDKAKMMKYKALLEKHLSDPIKLRITTMAGLLITSAVIVYMPLSKKIEESQGLYAKEKERNNYIAEYEKLEKQAAMFRAYIGDNFDSNKWVQYLLDGLRQYEIKLRGMEAKQPKTVGPYQAVTFVMELEGTYPEQKKYVHWLESSKSFIRIDSIQMEKKAGSLMMKIYVSGMLPKKNDENSK